jgi:hypothetical protein
VEPKPDLKITKLGAQKNKLRSFSLKLYPHHATIKNDGTIKQFSKIRPHMLQAAQLQHSLVSERELLEFWTRN